MKKHRGFTLIEIMIVVAILGILAAISIPSLKEALETSRMRACEMNRRNLDAAKMRWAMEGNRPFDVVPADEDLFGPMRGMEQKPVCPGGGIYTLNAVGEKTRCSVTRHVPASVVGGSTATP